MKCIGARIIMQELNNKIEYCRGRIDYYKSIRETNFNPIKHGMENYYQGNKDAFEYIKDIMKDNCDNPQPATSEKREKVLTEVMDKIDRHIGNLKVYVEYFPEINDARIDELLSLKEELK